MPLETDLPYQCPYCGVTNYIGVDPTAGRRQRLIEDCQICCSPIVFEVRTGDDGEPGLLCVEAES